MKTAMVATAVSWLAVNWRWLLVLSVLPLFTDNALYNAPLSLMALLGLSGLWRQRQSLLQQENIRWLLVGFAALWLPQVIAMADAVADGRSMKTVLAYPAYMLAAVFIVLSLGSASLRKLGLGILIVMAIWIADAVLGWSGFEAWLGYSISGIKITGALYSKPTLGHVLAVLSPLAFDYLRQHGRSPLAWLLLIGLVLVVMLSGRRVAWLMLIVAGAGYLVYLMAILRCVRFRAVAAIALICLLIPAALYSQYKPFHDRVNVTLGLFSADKGEIDLATSHRLDIWATAGRVAMNHWFNGVGPRGFRYIYNDYAPAADYWLQSERGTPTHPHQLLLEIAAETGLVGLAGYLLFWLTLYLALRKTTTAVAWPYVIALCVALFPLNSHLAFYGSYWTALCWWLIGIVYSVRETEADSPDGPDLPTKTMAS